MSFPWFIGLVGHLECGKDTAAQVFVSQAHYTRIAFADAIKADVAAYLGISLSQLRASKAKYRSFIIEYGQHMRHLHSDWWIRLLASTIKSRCYLSRFVVSDVRLLIEAAWVRSHAGILIRVQRTHAPVHTASSDITETEQDRIQVHHSFVADSVQSLTCQISSFISDLEAKCLVGT